MFKQFFKFFKDIYESIPDENWNEFISALKRRVRDTDQRDADDEAAEKSVASESDR